MSRPEDQLPPELFYSTNESAKYTRSTRIQTIQAQMAWRALELLDLKSPSLVLDIGCGSGLSGAILASVPPPVGPHTWVGMDISPAMLATAVSRSSRAMPIPGDERMDEDHDSDADEEEADTNSDGGLSSSSSTSPSAQQSHPNPNPNYQHSPNHLPTDSIDTTSLDNGDLFLADIGQGVPFRAGSFDAAISISAIQWLCAAPTSNEGASAEQRLRRFFNGLYAALRRGARAVCQFYPRDAAQRDLVCSAAIRAGFGAGLLEDRPNTKAAKTYLVLTVGGGNVAGGDITGVVRGWQGVDVVDDRGGRSGGVRMGGGKHGKENANKKGSKDWIARKKALMERRGKVVKRDSKYTGRQRRIKF